MRRYALALLYIVACLAIALPFVGCESSPIDVNGRAILPAVKADVDALRTDHDAAISKLRSDTGDALETLRKEKNTDLVGLRADIEAVKSTGQQAYESALKSGASVSDALNTRFAAEKTEAENRLADALKKAQENTNTALADAKGKAETATATATKAAEDAKNSTSPLGTILGGVGTLLVALGLGKYVHGLQAAAKIAQAIAGYDAAPFTSADAASMDAAKNGTTKAVG